MERKHLYIFLASLIFMGLLTLASILYYRADAVKRASELTYQRLSDSAKEQSLTLNAKMGGQFAILETFAESITLKEYSSKPMMMEKMNNVLSSSPFLHMGFIRSDGKGFLNDGKEVNVSDRSYFQRGMAGRRSIERVSRGKIEKFPRFIVSIPLVINRKTVGIIYGSYNEDMLRDLIVPHVFEGRGASYICDSKGNIIISSNSSAYIFGKGKPLYGVDNVLDGYAKTKAMGDSTVSDMRKNFAEGRRGVYRFSIGGYTRYVIYEPLPINDWFLLSGIAGEIVDDAVSEAAVMPMILFALMAVSMLIIIVIILKWEQRNRRILETEEGRLRVSEEKYRIASEQSGTHVVRFDIKDKIIYQDFGSNCLFGSEEVVKDVPESNIKSGLIETESVDTYRRFYQAIISGERSGSSVIKMRDAAGEKPKYYKCEFTTIYDAKNAPIQAVISFYDITAQREKELAYELWQQGVSKIPKEKIKIFEHNLTHDVLENVRGELKLDGADEPGVSFNAKTLSWASKNVCVEDFDNYVKFMNLDRLLKAYYNGQAEDSMDFRIYSNDESALCWINLSVHMVEYPSTHDVKAYMIYEDINDKKHEELAMEERLQEDPLTGVLNRKYFEDKVNSIIKKEPASQHAIFMIDLDNFKLVNDSYGHVAGDRVLISMSKALKAVLRAGDLVGRIGGDEFMVCLRNISYTEAIEKRAGFICQLMKIEITDGVFASGSLGISIYPRDGMNFNDLYKCADVAVYKAKEKGRCRFEFYSPEMRDINVKTTVTPIDMLKTDDNLSDERKRQLEDVMQYNKKLLQRQEEDERFRIFMERCDIASAEYNFRTKTFVASESFYKYEISEQRGEQLFSKNVDISGVHPDDRVLYREQILNESAASSNDMQVALRLKLLQGEYVWCRLTVIHMRGAEGGIERSIGVISREDALKNQSYVQLEALTKYMLAGMVLLEVGEQNISPIYVSQSMKRMTGINPSANVYSFDDISSLFYPEDRTAIFADFYKSVVGGNLFECTVRMKLRGKNGWCNIRAVRIPYEESRNPVAIVILTDVTEIKEKEEELSIERERMEIAFENTTINFWDFIYDGAKIIQTKRSYDFHGYPMVIENVPQSLIDSGYIYTDDISLFREMYKKLYDGAKNVSGVFRVKKENSDQYQYEHIRYTNVFDDKGRPIRAVGFSECISMAYIGLAGDSVLNVNEVISTLAISKLVGIFKIRLDDDFTVIYGNEYYYNLHGYRDREDMKRAIELKAVRYVHPDYRDIIKNDIGKAVASGAPNHRFEMVIVTKQGDKKMVMVWGAFIDDGDGKCLIGGVIDETELYEQKERLNTQTLMLSTAEKHADLYYWIYDIKQSKASFCRRLQDELGVPEVMANFPDSILDRDIIDPDYKDRFVKLHEDLKNGIPEAEADIRLIKGIWHRFKYMNVLDAQGRPVKAMGTAQNIQPPLDSQLKVGKGEEHNAELTARAHLSYIFEMSALETFEVDINTHEAVFSKGSVSKYKIHSTVVENVPDSLIETGLIHDDSLDSYREFYADVYAGKPNGSTIIKAQRASGQFTLVKLSYRMVYDEGGRPYKAIGISEEVENIADSRLRFEQEEKLHLLIKYDLVCLLRVNLSKDRITYFEAPGCTEMKFDSDRTYGGFLKEICLRFSGQGECEDFNSKYSAEALSLSSNNGIDWLYNEYRLCNYSGNIDWVSVSCQILTNPHNGDLYAFIYIRTIDERKKRELSLPFKAELDSTCSMYNKKTMKAIVNKVLSENKNPQTLYALAVIKIANLNLIIERFGPLSVDRLMLSVNRKLRYTLLNRQITCRTAEDRIVIFMDNVESERVLYEFGEYVLQILNKPAFFTTISEQYTIYQTGAAIVSAEIADFDKMLDLAQSATDKADMLKPHVQYYQDSLELKRDNVSLLPYKNDGSHLSLSAAAASSECSAYLFVLCSEILLSNKDTKIAVDGVLEQIGFFFGAERSYVLEVDEGKKALDNTYEWCADDVSSQIDELKGVPLDSVPSFMRAYKEKKTLVIKGLDGLCESEAKILGSQGITNLFVTPYVADSVVTGFVGVDNPSQNLDEIGVLSTLTYFLMSEVVKRRNDEHRLYTSRYDILSGVLSRNSYVEYVLETNAESLSSLGVILTDINGLKELNSRYGNSYGDQVVKSVAAALKDKFGAESVYRYGGGMFLVLLPDISKESFSQRLSDLRESFNSITNYDVSVGNAWSDTVHSIDSLIIKSDEVLTADKRERGIKIKAKKEAEKNKMLPQLLAAIDNSSFVPYLQPKVDAKTLAVCGAEALVRFKDPEHGIIPPGKFIPILEETGLVRYLDFFMFEEVLRIQHKWKEEGRTLMPISLNFSRSTMLEPGVVENLLSISQKYDVPNEMVEIEITESLGDFEAETIKQIGNNILQAGYRLSLDDFGAKYSNLAILSWLKFSVLKLDKSLVDHIVSNEMNRSIIAHVISLCQKYKIEVVAEGVEADIQLKELRDLGCGSIQGYLINKPIPVSDFESIYFRKD